MRYNRYESEFLKFPSLRNLMVIHNFQHIDELVRKGRVIATNEILADQGVEQALRRSIAKIVDGCIIKIPGGNVFEGNWQETSAIVVPFAFLCEVGKDDCSTFEQEIYCSRTTKFAPSFTVELPEWTGMLTLLITGDFLRNRDRLLKINTGHINLYATQTNIVPILSQDLFPYGAEYKFESGELILNNNLNQYFKFILNRFGGVEDVNTAFNVMRRDMNVPLTGYTAYVSENIPLYELEKPCCSYLCVRCEEIDIEKVKIWAMEAVGFLPSIYLTGTTSLLPDFLPFEGEYVRFEELVNKYATRSSIESTTTENGIKVLSWNVEMQSTLAYGNTLNISFPFTSWKCYKYPRIAKLIAEAAADICCFSEASPIVEIYHSNESISNAYHLVAEGLDSETKMSPGNSFFTAILIRKSFSLLHSENFAFTRISYDIPLARKLGMKEPVDMVRLSPFETYNSVSFAVVEKDGERIVVAALYPVWRYAIEPVKYFQIKYVFMRCEELSQIFECASTVVCGDYNITPSSGIYECFEKNVSAQEADNATQQEIDEVRLQDAWSERKNQQDERILFADYVSELRICGMHSVFSGMGGNGNTNDKDEVETVPNQQDAAEPKTTTVVGFSNCLDYQFTNMIALERCPVYNADGAVLQPNSSCVSDHSPLISVLAHVTEE